MTANEYREIREAIADELATIRVVNAALRIGDLAADERGQLYEARRDSLVRLRHLLNDWRQ
jgi:hypothetical protein